jgi:hypothetical protein
MLNSTPKPAAARRRKRFDAAEKVDSFLFNARLASSTCPSQRPAATKIKITATVTARALPSVGWPSRMSFCAFTEGMPGTSSKIEAIIAV